MDEQLDMAKQLCDLAMALDFAKGEFSPQHLKSEAVGVIRDMHKLAEELAGDRVGEIYAQDDA